MTTLPISRVVVLEDRAQVERAGALPVQGLTRIEIPHVSEVAVDRSLRVEVEGATLVDAKFVRRWKEHPRGGVGPDASEAQKKRKALELDVQAQADDVVRLETRAAQLAEARADLLRAIAEQAGAGTGQAATWTERLALVSTAQATCDDELRAARQAASTLHTRLQELTRAIALAEQPVRTYECVLALTLEGSGSANVKVSYLVPCAAWRPAYRATLTTEPQAKVMIEAEAVVWQRTGEEWTDVTLSLSTARPTLGASPPTLVEDRLSTRPKASIEKRVVDVMVREEAIQTAGEDGAAAPEFPGLDDGGEVRLLSASGKASIPSDGQPHRVPLFRFEAPASLERICAAELSPLVSLVGRFPNTSGQALLAGPVQVIRSAGAVGRTQLGFFAPNETVKLSFGSEDSVRVIREPHEKSEEAALTGRRTTMHTINLHVSNAGLTPMALVVEERIPVSEVKEVEVELLTRDCKPAPSAVTKEGIARIELSLPPAGTTTAKFVWKLSAAAKVAGV